MASTLIDQAAHSLPSNSPAPSLRQRIVGAHPQWWLGAMLLALHASLAWGIDQWWSRAFLLAHLGLFLIWQPVWRGEGDLKTSHAVLVVIVGALLSVWNTWWFMAVWLAVLFSLIGGNVPGIQQRMQRVVSHQHPQRIVALQRKLQFLAGKQ